MFAFVIISCDSVSETFRDLFNQDLGQRRLSVVPHCTCSNEYVQYKVDILRSYLLVFSEVL